MTKKDIIILGCDIHGLEIIDMINSTGQYRFIGFVSASEDCPTTFEGYPVLGNADVLQNYPDACRVPSHVWKDDTDKTNWVNIIAPSAFVASSATLGIGCVVYPFCFIGTKATLADGVLVLANSIINHDCIIGDRAILASNVSLAGSVNVKAGAYLGQACTVKQYLTVGSNSTVGMGAVVTRNVPDGATVVGCPARALEK